MKNKIFLCVLGALVWAGSVYAQQETESPQSTSSLSNGTLQISKVCLPDSILFTVAPGKEIDYVAVYLIGEGKELEGDTRVSGSLSIKTVNGKMVYSYTDESQFKTDDFKIPPGFKAERIRFEANGKKMYYNIALSEWEDR
ncbi:MAG: hypothetical protein LBK65_01650 [Tannerellaceae bacterium]|jgi:hypothetical protein|nr:hypothetical protein [Tannerellaceae bacterium]